MATRGLKDQWWEIKRAPGPYADPDATREIFKCTGCGAETAPPAGWNGQPDRHRCRPGCPCAAAGWKIGRASGNYRANFDRVFPDAPGAGF